MAEHIYCGSGKERVFQDGGTILSVSLDMDMLIANFKEYGYVSKNGKRYITVKVGKRREVGMYGETHTVEVDTWKPVKQETKPVATNQPASFQDDPIPF
jgi:hypothetical protein